MDDKLNVNLSIDLKKCRLRIHKHMLHQIGNPPFIQILVNPKERTVAILGVDNTRPGDMTHRIDPKRMLSDNSVEIYSKSFINLLLESSQDLDKERTYRMDGKIVPDRKLAIFQLSTLRCVK